MPLEVTYSPLLVLCSLAVAIMASFAALRLTSNLRHLSPKVRKIRVTQGALALGVGIWSMHFIGMLAVTLPIAISYDPLPTLASALIAILVVGMAFLSLHFGLRSRSRIVFAGTLTGLGIVGMHYLGMSAISANCIVTYSPLGVVLAIGVGIASSIAAVELAYGNRSLLSLAVGATVLGLAISAMHYTAMGFTVFSLGAELAPTAAPFLESHELALVVALSSFVLSGLFLLMAIPDERQAEAAAPAPPPAETAGEAVAAMAPDTTPATAPAMMDALPERPVAESGMGAKIPYERDKALRFLPSSEVHTIRADGHYTRITDGIGELFCPWPISRVEKSLDPTHFVRTHRSYIVNKDRITGFRRDGDKAYCIVGDRREIEVPVSRSRVPLLREILCLD